MLLIKHYMMHIWREIELIVSTPPKWQRKKLLWKRALLSLQPESTHISAGHIYIYMIFSAVLMTCCSRFLPATVVLPYHAARTLSSCPVKTWVNALGLKLFPSVCDGGVWQLSPIHLIRGNQQAWQHHYDELFHGES